MRMISTDGIRMVVFGDVHLGHHRTPTEHIVRNLSRLIPDNSLSSSIDFIIIEGDLFDRLLSFPDQNVAIIRNWISNLLKMCVRYDITLYILEGTPSHDWKQSVEFAIQNVDIGAKMKYFTNISIEYNEEYDLHFLFVPDEANPTTQETWEQVVSLMRKMSLEKVDFAIMHGMFEYQTPLAIRGKGGYHLEANYLSIVNELIMIGHVHTQSQCERILAAGSTDRISHGEEEDKGIYDILIKGHRDYVINFVVNEHAMIYHTIDLRNMDADTYIDAIRKRVETFPDYSYVRVFANRNDVASQSMKVINELFPQFEWSLKIADVDGEKKAALADRRKLLPTFSLTRDTLKPLLLSRIQEKYPDYLERAKELLENVTNE